ncbi:hypothetical protein ABLT31_22090 [Ammoniphilus sp. 3BR4]
MGLGVFLAGIIAMVFALTLVILPYDETGGSEKERNGFGGPFLLGDCLDSLRELAPIFISDTWTSFICFLLIFYWFYM